MIKSLSGCVWFDQRNQQGNHKNRKTKNYSVNKTAKRSSACVNYSIYLINYHKYLCEMIESVFETVIICICFYLLILIR